MRTRVSVGCDGGVLGVIGVRDAADAVTSGLRALDHRGERGVVVAGESKWGGPRSSEAAVPARGFSIPGRVDSAIGMVAPSRSGRAWLSSPVVARTAVGEVGLLTTGRLVNRRSLERELLASGAVFTGTSDAELLMHLLAQSQQGTLVNRLVDALLRARGAFGLVLLAEDRLVAMRDPLGLRPLLLGRLGRAVIVASESRAIAGMGGTGYREVEPGEMVILDDEGLTSLRPIPGSDPRPCLRELVSVARHDSEVYGLGCHEVRRAFGAALATTIPPGTDLVTGLGPAGNVAALGLAQELGIDFGVDLVTETGPERLPRPGAEGAFVPGVSVAGSAVQGRSVVLVHDSIGPEAPWGTAIRGLRQAGVRRIHARLAAPPTRYPCIYGVPLMPSPSLAPTTQSEDEVRDEIGADSFAWLELGSLREVAAAAAVRACDGCYSGSYPLVHEDLEEPQLPLFSAP
jgi:amidophosphoribosyltransferase